MSIIFQKIVLLGNLCEVRNANSRKYALESKALCTTFIYSATC